MSGQLPALTRVDCNKSGGCASLVGDVPGAERTQITITCTHENIPPERPVSVPGKSGADLDTPLAVRDIKGKMRSA